MSKLTELPTGAGVTRVEYAQVNEAESTSDFISKEAIALRLDVTPRTIEQWVKRGVLPVCKLTGKAVRFHWPSCERAILSRQINGAF